MLNAEHLERELEGVPHDVRVMRMLVRGSGHHPAAGEREPAKAVLELQQLAALVRDRAEDYALVPERGLEIDIEVQAGLRGEAFHEGLGEPLAVFGPAVTRACGDEGDCTRPRSHIIHRAPAGCPSLPSRGAGATPVPTASPRTRIANTPGAPA